MISKRKARYIVTINFYFDAILIVLSQVFYFIKVNTSAIILILNKY